MAETVGSRLRTALAANGWNQSDLVRETGIDKNTISAIANDRSVARASTLTKIEDALALTPGTLAGGGEEQERSAGVRLADLSAAELIAELTYRLESFQRDVAGLQAELQPLREAEGRRHDRRISFLADVDEDSDPEDQWIAHEWEKLLHEAAEGGGWGPEERLMRDHLERWIDSKCFQRDFPSHHGVDSPPIPSADDMRLAARTGRSRGKDLHARLDGLGEESQDG